MSVKIRERDVESYLVEKLKEANLPCIKFQPDHRVGMPDRLIILPDQRVRWVELKTSGGHLEEIQKLQHKRLRERGHYVNLLWTKADVDRLVEELTSEENGEEF